MNSSCTRSSANTAFPEELSGFRFLRVLDTGHTESAYSFGIYENEAGEKALAKRWTGRCRHMSARWLKNEAAAYRTLWRVIGLHPEIRERYPHVHIPKLIGTFEDDFGHTLLIEYVEGSETAEHLDNARKLSVYGTVLGYLGAVGLRMLPGEVTGLPRRGLGYMMLILPMLTVASVMRHPESFSIIIRSAFQFLVRPPQPKYGNHLVYSHRDLGDRNMLLRGDEIWIIDFQLAAMARPLTDAVALTLRLLEEPELLRLFMTGDFMAPILHSGKRKRDFESLTLFLSLYNLGMRNGSEAQLIIGRMADIIGNRVESGYDDIRSAAGR